HKTVSHARLLLPLVLSTKTCVRPPAKLIPRRLVHDGRAVFCLTLPDHRAAGSGPVPDSGPRKPSAAELPPVDRVGEPRFASGPRGRRVGSDQQIRGGLPRPAI